MQDRASFSVNRTDTSVSHSKQLDSAIPASRIAGLSSGEFVGMMADDPQNRVDLKTFHSSIQNDHQNLEREHNLYKKIPFFRQLPGTVIQANYLQIKNDVGDLIDAEIGRMINDPVLAGMVVNKWQG
jgi:hypothetical protein